MGQSLFLGVKHTHRYTYKHTHRYLLYPKVDKDEKWLEVYFNKWKKRHIIAHINYTVVIITLYISRIYTVSKRKGLSMEK